jgi:hypothetical protein
MPKNKTLFNYFPRRRIQMGLTFAVAGFLIFIVGVKPEIFQLDRSPVLGYIQIGVMLVGLGILCLGGYICMSGLWKGHGPSIAAELGMRIISTGYIIAVFAGLADIFGFGSHPFPEFIPYFGIWQARGVQIGEGFIAIGLLMMLPYSRHAFFNSHQTLPSDDHPD